MVGVMGFALMQGDGVAVWVGDEGDAAGGVVLDVHDQGDIMQFEMGDCMIEIDNLKACAAAVGVGFPLIGCLSEGERLASKIVFQPTELTFVLEGDGFA